MSHSLCGGCEVRLTVSHSLCGGCEVRLTVSHSLCGGCEVRLMSGSSNKLDVVLRVTPGGQFLGFSIENT